MTFYRIYFVEWYLDGTHLGLCQFSPGDLVERHAPLSRRPVVSKRGRKSRRVARRPSSRAAGHFTSSRFSRLPPVHFRFFFLFFSVQRTSYRLGTLHVTRYFLRIHFRFFFVVFSAFLGMTCLTEAANISCWSACHLLHVLLFLVCLQDIHVRRSCQAEASSPLLMLPLMPSRWRGPWCRQRSGSPVTEHILIHCD